MALDLQAILDAVQTGEDVTPEQRREQITEILTAEGVGPEDISALIDEVVEQFSALRASADDDSLLGMELLAEVADAARAVQADLDAKAEADQARRDELATRVLGDEPDAEKPDADAESGTAEVKPDADSAADSAATAESSADAAADVSAEAAADPVAIAASAGRRFNLATITPPADTEPADTKPTGLSITAAAGVRGVENGANLDMDGLVAATQARIAGMPRGKQGHGTVVRDGVAQIKVDYPDALVASGDNDQKVLDHAGDQSRLDGGLIASGGWCAPSETLYDLAPPLADPNAGLIDVPDIQVKRGGIRTTEGVSFASVWAGNAGLVQTEAQAIDPDTPDKALYRPTCPEFTETRLDVVYSGIVVGFLQNDAYPEVTRDAIAGVTAVHAHRVNKLTIERMANESTAVDLTATIGPSATGSILNGLGLLITDARYRFRAPESLVLDVVLPIWAKEVVRADYALRGGIPLEQVTDQQIAGWIQARGGRVQWVYDWQDAFSSSPAAGFGGATAQTGFPAEVNALVYPAGTFVRGRGEVVNLDTVYDSTLTVQNDFLQMFMEEKLLVRKRAYQSLNAKLALGVNGTVGAGQVLDGNGKVVAAPTGD